MTRTSLILVGLVFFYAMLAYGAYMDGNRTAPIDRNFVVLHDKETGCQYIATDTGVAPRLRSDGTPWCDPVRR